VEGFDLMVLAARRIHAADLAAGNRITGHQYARGVEIDSAGAKPTWTCRVS